MRLIVSAQEAEAAIRSFQRELAASAALQDRLGYARSWYVLPVVDGFLYGPSKWVGYAEITAAAYLGSKELDGRKTEAALKSWFEPIGRDTPEHAMHLRNLGSVMARFGKTPSAETRFNMFAAAPVPEKGDPNGPLLDLLVAVALTLPPELRAQLRKRIS